VIVEMVRPYVPLLITVKGSVSDLPTTTSPKRKVVGLRDNWVAAAAEAEDAAVRKNARSDSRNAYLCTSWGRVITASVCRGVRDQ